ncbi:hypothetical protein G5I_10093 [Acromyrmex echinatior]|uniref:Uncharacterized protein n=1 Tax=Acromyrmex echinatior TaxID=103372 RepID=F4WW59_ACREC|nr:hypothetical protein G5I_10093 [Acromyrmex echinatior]
MPRVSGLRAGLKLGDDDDDGDGDVMHSEATGGATQEASGANVYILKYKRWRGRRRYRRRYAGIRVEIRKIQRADLCPFLPMRVFDPSGKTHWHSGGFASVVCDLLKALFTIGFYYRPKRHETRTRRRRTDRTLMLTLLKNARIADQNNTPPGKPYASRVGGEMEDRRALFLQIAVVWRVDKCICIRVLCQSGDGAVATAAEPTAAAMVSHSKRDSRHFSRRCRVSRDGERYFSPIRVYTRSRANTLRIAPRGDWYATGKVDTRDLRTLQTINICATNSKRRHLEKKCCANNLILSAPSGSAKDGGIILVAWCGRRHQFIERFFLVELKSLKTRTITKIKDSRTCTLYSSATKNRPLSSYAIPQISRGFPVTAVASRDTLYIRRIYLAVDFALLVRDAITRWGIKRTTRRRQPETAERPQTIADKHENSTATTTTTTTTVATAGDATGVLAPTTRATTDDVIVAIPRNLGAAPLHPACGILAPIPGDGDAAGDAVTIKSMRDLPASLCNLSV